MAVALDATRSKDDILELYLNQIYLGNGAEGIEEASRHWFAKPAAELTVAESALLASLVPAPAAYGPDDDPDGALLRRNRVLDRMVDIGAIDEAACRVAKDEPIGVAAHWMEAPVRAVGRTYRGRVREVVGDDSGPQVLGMDAGLQAIAEQAVRDTVAAVSARHRYGVDGGVQAAVVVIDNETGLVRALVGGTDETVGGFDRATQARRQPGSAFKAVVYAAALQGGRSQLDVVDDAPHEVPSGRGQVWVPHNHMDEYRGPMSLRTALAVSSNVVAVKLTQEVGIPEVRSMAEQLGIHSPIAEDYTIALGSSGVSLMELTSAYATIARGGLAIEPRFLEGTPVDSHQALSPGVAAELRDMLAGVVQRGTGRPAYRAEQERMGKTGTSNDGRDAWFIGATPELTIGVWVGRDDNEPMWESGAHAALPVFIAIADAIPVERADFLLPEGARRRAGPWGAPVVVRPKSSDIHVALADD